MQQRLAGDYEAVRLLLAAASLPVPEEVRLGVMRCDRPEELGALDKSCDQKGRCESRP